MEATERKIVLQLNDFALKLFQRLHTSSPSATLIYSPLALVFALQVILNGNQGSEKEIKTLLAVDEFSTEQLNAALPHILSAFNALDSKTVNIDSSSCFFIRKEKERKFHKEFEDQSDKLFRTKIKELPKTEKLNDWLKSNVNKKIAPLLPQNYVDDATKAVLLNAVCFKGEWNIAFNKKDTKERPFHKLDGTQQNCDMMTLFSDQFRFFETDFMQAIDLPYGNQSRFFATILLPRDKTTTGLNEVMQHLHQNEWSKCTGFFATQAGTLSLPRIKLATCCPDIAQDLGSLGLTTPFNNTADFAKVSSMPLFLSRLAQGVSLEINESGTEEQDDVEVEDRDEKPFIMTVDHSFILVIREVVSKALLFVGQITELTK